MTSVQQVFRSPSWTSKKKKIHIILKPQKVANNINELLHKT